jgi:hypothetical protein
MPAALRWPKVALDSTCKGSAAVSAKATAAATVAASAAYRHLLQQLQPCTPLTPAAGRMLQLWLSNPKQRICARSR